MRVERVFVDRLDPPRRPGHCRPRIAASGGLSTGFRLCGAHPCIEFALVGKRVAGRAPVDPHCARGFDRTPFSRRDHSDKAAFDDRLHEAGDRLRCTVVNTDHLGADPGRADDAPVQHARDTNVDDVAECAEDLLGNVGPPDRCADNRIVRGTLRFSRALDVQREAASVDLQLFTERRVSGQLSIRDRSRRRRFRPNDAIQHRQSVDRCLQTSCRGLQQETAHRRSDIAECRSARGDRVARAHAALVGCAGGIAHDHRHLRHGHAQFLGDDLGERHVDAHPDFHFSGAHGDCAVRRNPQPGVDPGKRRSDRSGSGRWSRHDRLTVQGLHQRIREAEPDQQTAR